LKTSHFFFLILLTVFFFDCKNKNEKQPTSTPTLSLQKLAAIPSELPEISGMVYTSSQTIYAHNDGGHPANIYKVKLDEKKILKTIKISDVENKDWEEMTQDSQYVYLGDFGNNKGARTDLKIFKILKKDIETLDSVKAEIIEFKYSDQTKFEKSKLHNFDCEAMISWGDSLLLFSKNRGDLKTKFYTIPKKTGNHEATLVDKFDIKSQVTAAAFDYKNNVFALLSYEYDFGTFHPFVTFFYEFENKNFFNGKYKKYKFPFDAQFESTCFGDNGNLYFGHESEKGGSHFFYKLNMGSITLN